MIEVFKSNPDNKSLVLILTSQLALHNNANWQILGTFLIAEIQVFEGRHAFQKCICRSKSLFHIYISVVHLGQRSTQSK